jgi:glucosamine-6-phosphate deaminase
LTGDIKKKPISDEDIAIVTAIIAKIKPHQVFCCRRFVDPHGTHEVCLNTILLQ